MKLHATLLRAAVRMAKTLAIAALPCQLYLTREAASRKADVDRHFVSDQPNFQ